MCSQEMPKYQSIKQVWALKIKEIYPKLTKENQESDGSKWMQPEEEGYGKISLSHQYLQKHNPQVGGYYVLYKDGYESFSPAEPFEDGNVPFSPLISMAEVSQININKPWKERVIAEYVDLRNKLAKLREFIKEYDSTDPVQYDLMTQSIFMDGYLHVLSDRIKGFK